MTDDRTSVATIGRKERMLPVFEDKLMGVPVILLSSAIEAEVGGEIGIIVPDLEELGAAVAVARVAIPNKLTGEEIRALRKAIGMRANALADFLDVTPETFSRWENNKEIISKNAERLLRLKVHQTLRTQVRGVVVKSEDILGLQISHIRLVSKPLALVFQRVRAPGGEHVWWFRGSDEQELQEIQVA
jgi:transcriptional regulator with XRE-family HTH domain